MRVRKAVAGFVAVAALSLSATPAYGESMNSWSKQTKSHFLKLINEANQAEKAKNEGALIKDLRAFAEYGKEHPPPGVDRRGFVQTMNDLSQACDALSAGNASAAEADLTKDQNEAQNLTALPSYWTSGNFP